MRAIYNVLFTIGLLLFAPFYFVKLWRRGNWREGFGERFGRYSSKVKQALTNRRVIWVHGASVGEASLANLVVRALEARCPQHKFVVSAVSTTGMAELRRKLPGNVEKVYYPFDRRVWVRRAFSVLRPEAVVLIEAELWPNFLWHARRRRVPVALVNARISESGYRGYRRLGFVFRDLFRSLAAVTTQSERDIGRLVELGCRPEVLRAVGSLKFEPVPPLEERPLDVARLLRHAGMPDGARVLLAGSTHEGEEALLAEVFQRLRKRFPQLYLVLVPRHFERCRAVGRQLGRRGLRFVYRSEVRFASPPEPGASECLLVNSTGELRHFYPHADVVFVGKSLVPGGGQNPIEPAAVGRAIVFGPHMENFPDIAPRLVAADAAVQVEDAVELETVIEVLLRDDARRARLGANAQKVIESHRGALDRTVEAILAVLEERERG